MKILRICWEWPPPWSGLAPGPYEMTAAQAAAGHEITYLCGGASGDPVENLDGVDARRMGPYRRLAGPLFTACVKTAVEFRKESRRAEIIHGHGILTLWVNLLFLLGAKHPPYVYHFHSCAQGADEKNRRLGVEVGATPGQWVYRRALRLCEKLAVKTADRFIAVSESIKKEIMTYYNAPEERISVVDNGVNCDLFSPGGPDGREQYGFKEDDVVLVFAGIIRPLKNVHLIIDSLLQLPENVKALLAGPWETDYKRMLDDRVAEKNLGERVVFTGPVEYRDMPRVYRTGDVFLLPSATEGFPKVVLEAAATGLPAIASGFRTEGLLAEAINFLDERNLDGGGIADAVRMFIDGKGKRPVDNGLFRSVYDWRIKAAELEKIYGNLL